MFLVCWLTAAMVMCGSSSFTASACPFSCTHSSGRVAVGTDEVRLSSVAEEKLHRVLCGPFAAAMNKGVA